jgi:hypothetical protein
MKSSQRVLMTRLNPDTTTKRTLALQVTPESPASPEVTSAGNATGPVAKHGFAREKMGANTKFVLVDVSHLSRGYNTPAETAESRVITTATLANIVNESDGF